MQKYDGYWQPPTKKLTCGRCGKEIPKRYNQSVCSTCKMISPWTHKTIYEFTNEAAHTGKPKGKVARVGKGKK